MGTQIWGGQGTERRLALVPQALSGYLGWVISFGLTTPTMEHMMIVPISHLRKSRPQKCG